MMVNDGAVTVRAGRTNSHVRTAPFATFTGVAGSMETGCGGAAWRVTARERQDACRLEAWAAPANPLPSTAISRSGLTDILA